MSKIYALDGNAAIAYGVMRSKTQLIAAYPITPQTPIVENIASLIDKGLYDATYINVESEHSALSAVVGASTTGVRTFTASASHGIALMHELTGVASGSRLPIVMAVVNRAMPSPMSLWCDHTDIMSQRDQGWLQLFAKSPQEALDFIMVAYRTSEHLDVLLPTMVSIDGFYVSHLTEPVSVPSPEEAEEFIGDFKAENLMLDPDNPYAVNNLTSPEIFTEIKYGQKIGMDNALYVLENNFKEFEEKIGRKYDLFETYGIEDAETVLVCMGSMGGTALHVVKQMREEGQKVGLLRVISYRPFPKLRIAEILKDIPKIAVIDRVPATGTFGPLYSDILASLKINEGNKAKTYNFVAGLGGRDIWEKTIRDVFEATEKNSENNITCENPIWIDLKEGDDIG